MKTMIQTKNPKTQAKAEEILNFALSNPSEHVYPSWFQPRGFGIDASVSAAIRVLKKANLIKEDGLDGLGKKKYIVTSQALNKYHGFA